MSSQYDPKLMIGAYRRLLVGLRGAADLPPDAPMTSHWPVVGENYQGDLLVVGQAVFGWIPDWRRRDIDTDAGVEAVLTETREALQEREDPMSWIATNSHRGSPFWRAVQLLSDDLAGPTTQPWYSHVAWANLYPVARNDPAGNPTGDLLDLQTAAAADFLAATVQALRPRLVVVFAGQLWWPFQHRLGLDGLVDAQRPLIRTGQHQGTCWIVGWHPAGAQRRGFPPRIYTREVLKVANSPASE